MDEGGEDKEAVDVAEVAAVVPVPRVAALLVVVTPVNVRVTVATVDPLYSSIQSNQSFQKRSKTKAINYQSGDGRASERTRCRC